MTYTKEYQLDITRDESLLKHYKTRVYQKKSFFRKNLLFTSDGWFETPDDAVNTALVIARDNFGGIITNFKIEVDLMKE